MRLAARRKGEKMKEYAITVICTVALIVIGSVISYKEGGEITKLAFSLILTSSVLLPIIPIIEELASTELEDLDFSFEDHSGEYKETAEQAFEEGLADALCARFDIDPGDVRADINGFDFDSMSCRGIRVLLSGGAVFKNLTQIKAYLEMNFEGCDIRVEVG